MEYRKLGRSGLTVSVVGVGCNNFGRRCDPEQTKAVAHAALDAGIVFFDTADIYGPRGVSEEYLGKALIGRRHEVVLATKFAGTMGDAQPEKGGASRRYILSAVEASLKRLGTDYIDLYQIHMPDPATPLEETMRALDDLVRAGKVRYVGNSNFKGWQIASGHWISRTEHVTPFISAQNDYSLLNRDIEDEVVPACAAYGLGILPYSPLADGLLTGKYRRGAPAPQGTRLSEDSPRLQKLLSDRTFDVVEKLEEFARSAGHTLLELAIGWLASQPQVGSVIAGATKPEQVRMNAQAAGWKLSADELGRVDEITGKKS